jgi:hypothetical protein
MNQLQHIPLSSTLHQWLSRLPHPAACLQPIIYVCLQMCLPSTYTIPRSRCHNHLSFRIMCSFAVLPV